MKNESKSKKQTSPKSTPRGKKNKFSLTHNTSQPSSSIPNGHSVELSLPSLEEPSETENTDVNIETKFKGFTHEEIDSSEYYQRTSIPETTNDCYDTDKSQELIDTISPTLLFSKIGRSPKYSGKRKKTAQDTTRKKKRKYKNKLNRKLRLTNDFLSEDSDTSIEDTEEPVNKPIPPELIQSASKSKELTPLNAIITNPYGYKGIVPTRDPTKMFDRYKNKKYTRVTGKASPQTIKEITYVPTKTDSQVKNKEITPAETLDPTTCKPKELTIQSKGVLKHFLEYEVNDNIVIRAEKDASPEIEIEYIDNYTGANSYQEVCELSDDDGTKERNTPTGPSSNAVQENVTAECDDDIDDGIEVFQVVTEDAGELKINRASTGNTACVGRFSSYDRQAHVDETVKRILSDGNVKSNMERRKLKRPYLRSRFKKMGLLPVANFDEGAK